MREIPKRSISEFNSKLKLKGFNVFQIEADGNATKVYSRKDFYKICLTTGKSKIHYSDRSFEAEGTILFFGNPHVPYSWETLSTEYVGYTCLFQKNSGMLRHGLKVCRILRFLNSVEHPFSKFPRNSATF